MIGGVAWLSTGWADPSTKGAYLTNTPIKRMRVWFACFLTATLSLVAAACTTAAGGGPYTTVAPVGPPAVFSFSATRASGPSPLTTALTWSVPIPESTPFTCLIDLDDDGAAEISVAECTSSSMRSVTFDSEGTHTVRLSVTDGETTATSDAVNVTVGPASADTYDIDLRLAPGISPSQQAVFEAAASRWEEVVRTGLPAIEFTAPADYCGTGSPAFSGEVDDLLVDADVSPIDGPGGVLAKAGPCLVRSAGGLPVFAAMQFDSADVADLETDGVFETVVAHELGHAIGFGTVWDSLLVGAGSGQPRFAGLVARGAWDALEGGSGVTVPVEGGGGPGTADSHWREAVFESELMTGYIDPDPNPLSAVTIGALADLGYGVDLGAADSFGTPALHAHGTWEFELRSEPLALHEELLHPKGHVGG